MWPTTLMGVVLSDLVPLAAGFGLFVVGILVGVWLGSRMWTRAIDRGLWRAHQAHKRAMADADPNPLCDQVVEAMRLAFLTEIKACTNFDIVCESRAS